MGRLRRTLSKPGTWVRIHAGLAIFWALLTIPAVTLWKDSVPFLVSISMCALVLGSVASLQAARADCNSPTSDDLRRIEDKVDALRGKINLIVRGR